MKVIIKSVGDEEVGYLTATANGFDYEYTGDRAEEVRSFIERSQSYTEMLPDTEAEESKEPISPPEGEEEASADNRVLRLAAQLPYRFPLRVEEDDRSEPTEKALSEPTHIRGPSVIAKADRLEKEREDLLKGMDHHSMSFRELDDLLFNAYERLVWETTDDLAKSPDMWRGDDQVPEFVQEWLSFVVKNTDVGWDGKFEGLPSTAALTVKDIMDRSLTQPQGWSIRSISENLLDVYEDEGMDKAQAANIARTETAAYLNTSREEAYKAQEASTDADRGEADPRLYDWVGPRDHRETEICKEIREEVKKAGGMTMEQLKDTLYDVAKRHTDKGGTPERARDWLPHYQCRKTFVLATPGSERW